MNNKEITHILAEMKDLGKLKGVLLAYRDGGLIAENIDKNSDYSELAAMCASVLERAEGLGQITGGKISKIIAELDKQTIVIIESEKDTFLTFLIDKDSNFGIILNKIEDFNQKIKNLL